VAAGLPARGYAAPLFIESIVKQAQEILPEAALCACPGNLNAGGCEAGCISRMAAVNRIVFPGLQTAVNL
ncbi:hypothetical protein, partial [Klebsiella pneumoniae]|uniref:hypothetical protein n=1 Tax=Klebsiella pneumoniae TaxID=573 RepID=UPI001C6F74FD